MIALLVALLVLLVTPAAAQVSQPGFTCENHGAVLNFAPILNCGTGTTCTWTPPGICTITAAGGGGTITGSGAAPQVTVWSGASSITGFSGFTFTTPNLFLPAVGGVATDLTKGLVGFNTAKTVEVVGDGATLGAGTFAGSNVNFTLHDSATENNWQFVMYNNLDGAAHGLAFSIYGAYPDNTHSLNFGDGAGGSKTLVSLSATHATTFSSNFQFGAVGSSIITSPSGAYVHFDLSGAASAPNGFSNTFQVTQGSIGGSLGGSTLMLLQHDGASNPISQISTSNNAGTAVGIVKTELLTAPTSTKVATTMEATDAQGDLSLNLFSPTNSILASNVGTLSLNTTSVTAGSAPYLFFPKPGGGNGIAFHAADTYASTMLMTWPNAMPATSGLPLVSTTAGAMSFSALPSTALNITATTCTNQFIRSLSSTAVGTCATVANADLANSSVTVNGTSNQINTTSASISLGGSATLSLSSTITAPGTLAVTTVSGTPATYATFDSGNKLVAGDTYIPVRYGIATADTTVNNSVVETNITGMAISVCTTSTEIWEFEATYLLTATTTTPGFRFQFTVPTGVTGFYGPHATIDNAAIGNEQVRWDKAVLATTALAALVAIGTEFNGQTSLNGTSGWFVRGYLICSTTPGTFQAQFAQSTANASNSVVKKGSVIVARKVIP